MAYIELYDKSMLDVISLGKSINDFNMDLGDYVKVDIYLGTRKIVSLQSNKLMMVNAQGDLYFGDYHYHTENPKMGFCIGASHTGDMNDNERLQLYPLDLNGVAVENLSNGDEYKKQVNIFKDDSGQIYIKPKQLIESAYKSSPPRGRFRIETSFHRNIQSEIGLFLNNMKYNLIENGNFFAGLEATQTGDLDKSSGKNNIVMIPNPGFSKFVLNQNGLPGNTYSMKVTGIKPNTNYVFSCWVAWDSNYGGGTHLGTFTNVSSQATNQNRTVGLNSLPNTSPKGSYYDDIGNRVVDTRTINGLYWNKLYYYLSTNELADNGYIIINLGEASGNFYPSTSPLSNRYFTDLRLEQVSSFDGSVIQNYLNKLHMDSLLVPLLKKDTAVSTNRDERVEGEEVIVDTNTEIYKKEVFDNFVDEIEKGLEIDIQSVMAQSFPELYGQASETNETMGPDDDDDSSGGFGDDIGIYEYPKGGKIQTKRIKK